MTLMLLALGNSALGAALVYTRRWPRSAQAFAGKILGVLGILLALLLIDWGSKGLGWRSITLAPEGALLCGVAIAGCWVLIIQQGAFATYGMVAVAAAPLILAIGADWVVPQLLFSLVFFWAIAASALYAGASALELARPLVALALLAAGAIVMSPDTEGWLLPESVAAPERWLLLAGAGIAIVGLPNRVEHSGSRGLGEPLLVAAGFSLLPRVADGAPYQGAVLLALAVLLTIFSARRVVVTAMSAVPLLVLMAAALLAPQSATAAGLGAVLVATAAGASRMTGDPFRAALVALTPLTVGFAAIGSAAEEALTRAALAESNQVGWAVVALLFPLALAACLWAGISAGRSTGYEPPAQVRVTALALLGAIMLLLVAAPVSGLSAIGSGGGTVLLFLAALFAGVAATVRFAGRETATLEPPAGSQKEEEIVTSPAPSKHKRTETMALVLGAANLGMVGYLTFQGLKVGFL